LPNDSENTPLQLKLNDLAEAVAKIGSMAGGLFFVALLIRYFVQPGTHNPQRYVDVSPLASEQIPSFFMQDAE
jgi:Ca2+-transporting ATPase